MANERSGIESKKVIGHHSGWSFENLSKSFTRTVLIILSLLPDRSLEIIKQNVWRIILRTARVEVRGISRNIRPLRKTNILTRVKNADLFEPSPGSLTLRYCTSLFSSLRSLLTAIFGASKHSSILQSPIDVLGKLTILKMLLIGACPLNERD